MIYVLPIFYILIIYTAIYHVPKYDPNALGAEKTAKEAPVSSPDANKTIIPSNETPPVAVPVLKEETTSPIVPATGEASTPQEQAPPLNAGTPSEPNPVSNTDAPSTAVPAAGYAQTPPEQAPPLNAPDEPAPIERSVPEQNNIITETPASTGTQELTPVKQESPQEENAVPSAVPVKTENTESPEKAEE